MQAFIKRFVYDRLWGRIHGSPMRWRSSLTLENMVKVIGDATIRD
jgi:hypothetical protein